MSESESESERKLAACWILAEEAEGSRSIIRKTKSFYEEVGVDILSLNLRFLASEMLTC